LGMADDRPGGSPAWSDTIAMAEAIGRVGVGAGVGVVVVVVSRPLGAFRVCLGLAVTHSRTGRSDMHAKHACRGQM
jgi:hypothetical protein